MAPYVIFVDSGSDLSPDMLKKYDLVCIPLSVTVGNNAPVSENELDMKEVYAKLRAKVQVRTSAAGIETFIETFEPYLAAGTDVLYLGFSSGISGTYNAGFVAARELREKYPERTVETVDTLCASLGAGLIAALAAEKRLAGASLAEVRDYVESTKLHLCHAFTVEDLFFLHRGGRVSLATAVAGSALGIKPVMHVDNEGHLTKVGTARGRRASLDALCNRMQASAFDPKGSHVFISHGDCPDDAEYVARRLRETMGVTDVTIGYIGPVIGAHSGPGTVALFFLGKER